MALSGDYKLDLIEVAARIAPALLPEAEEPATLPTSVLKEVAEAAVVIAEHIIDLASKKDP